MSQNAKKEELKIKNVGDFDKHEIEKKEMTLEKLNTEIAKLRTENTELRTENKELKAKVQEKETQDTQVMAKLGGLNVKV